MNREVCGAQLFPPIQSVFANTLSGQRSREDREAERITAAAAAAITAAAGGGGGVPTGWLTD